ncbi:MAG: type II/IV secretion system protein [Gammaproteobacteria bacterium]|nr:secretion system protein E [Gammaproteobacteria bacterium]NIO61783.1 secretion system protein E [Gammaproteobacteria bacterium]NIP48653.1 type II/IV secretion system protein [Gammaproteobacteria bacterium]NIQ09105.1 type II/IV secretion system protein [Gammaproteobacteria bacterium]NIQ19034.1 secretion system protein E [Gammaproteobacteria bacterium]
MAKSNKKHLRLGEILVQQGVTTPDQIEIALTEQKKSKEKLGKILVRLGFATEAIIRDVIGGVIGQESVNLDYAVPDSEAVRLIPKNLARRLHVLPLTYDNTAKTLTVAMTDTFNVVVLDQISVQVGREIELVPVLAGEAEIEKAIDQFYGFELSVDGILNEIETGEIDYQSLDSETDEYSQPVVRLVNALLSDAVKRGASDIHFEPEEGFLRFRYRIDGVLRQIRSIHKDYWSAIAVRLKVMSGMDIAETRAPQDGRISLSLSGRIVDFRVSTLPTVHGENIVLRVLDRQKGIVALDKLGLKDDALNTLKIMVGRPEGIILVTGPTGSGKTTTLYSILNYLNEENVNIMTLEDPVEYPTSMIRQTSASETSRLDFASGIRSMMRQDPDIILVGEIRDEDTASMALRAAMTGHQVFSTLHTNSALGAIPRLLDIGVQADILAGNIIGVLAQRLVRKLCDACKESYQMSDLERTLLNLKSTDRQQDIFRAKGCQQCDGQGYRGRLAILEILHFDADMDELIARRGTQRELMRAALSKGFKTLADSGSDRVLDGSTSLEEVSRVIDLTGRITHK